MKSLTRSYFISAQNVNNNLFENEQNHQLLIHNLQDLNYAEAYGKYNGVEEKSVVVSCDSLEIENRILNLMQLFKQESILCVQGIDQSATLIFNDKNNTQKYLGKMTKLGMNIKDYDGDYTFVNNTFYVVK